MANLHFRLSFHYVTAALCTVLYAPVWAQTQSQHLPGVTVTAKAAPVLDIDRPDVSGWGQTQAKTPQSVTVLSADLIAASGASSLSQAIRLDASLADSYNTTGYVEGLSVRGFLLDPSNNFLRNGLPISNFAPLALENKERIEILKGVAGLQSGVSAPGGLVNFVTKTPQADPFTIANIGADSNGGSKVHLDSNTTWGAFGVRANIAIEGLRSHFDHAEGSREFAAIALTTRITPETQLTADLDFHRKKQTSVPGLGLLDANADSVGDTLPATVYSRLNLNAQPWSQPFEATSTNAQIALHHKINAAWQADLGVSSQSTFIHDRLAFPDGCSSASNYVYPGLCANGDVDVYDYRSEGESRKYWSWNAKLQGKILAFGVDNRLNFGLSGRSGRTDLEPNQAYNYAGTTNINSPISLPGDGTTNDLNTNNRERALDLSISLVSDLSTSTQSFLGLRTSRLSRSSERSDGSRPISFEQTITTPWAGLSWAPVAGTMVFGSWGQGAEMEAVPNRPTLFANPGQVLPALTSEQTEVGVKWQPYSRLLISASAFRIDKPYADDLSTGAGALRVAGGKSARHRGLEMTAVGQVDADLALQTSFTFMEALYTTAFDPSLVGQAVTNIPKVKASLFADYKLGFTPGLSINGLLSYEDGKKVTADGSVTLPSAWQIDAGLRFQHRLAGKVSQWSLNIENLTDRNYWREAPTQYWGGVYLFPSTPRTVRARVSFEL